MFQVFLNHPIQAPTIEKALEIAGGLIYFNHYQAEVARKMLARGEVVTFTYGFVSVEIKPL